MTERMQEILVAMLQRGATRGAEYGMTGNEIGMAVGFTTGSDRSAHDGRMMGAANRVNFSVSALERKGFVAFARRRGGLSGGARVLTKLGEQEARRIMGESDGYRSDATTAAADDEAVWVEEGFTDAEGLAPIRAGDVMFAPGSTVTVEDGHEMYGGEEGVVKAAGMGTGMYDGPTFDVLVEGTSDPERFMLGELAG